VLDVNATTARRLAISPATVLTPRFSAAETAMMRATTPKSVQSLKIGLVSNVGTVRSSVTAPVVVLIRLSRLLVVTGATLTATLVQPSAVGVALRNRLETGPMSQLQQPMATLGLKVLPLPAGKLVQ
jgi:hypothetical protein